jgi:hypothetical protein
MPKNAYISKITHAMQYTQQKESLYKKESTGGDVFHIEECTLLAARVCVQEYIF